MVVSGSFLTDPLEKVFIDCLAVPDGQDQDVIAGYFVHDSVISNTQLPVSLERFSKWCSVLLRGMGEARIGGVGNTTAEIARD